MVRCLIGLTVFVLANGVAWANLSTSKHNLSASGGEPCAYCHRVHNAVGGLGRPAYMGATLPDILRVYNSATLDHNLTTAAANLSDAPLCLTCHDGAFADTMADPERTAIRTLITNTSPLNIGGNALDLSNDHPVGFVYDVSLDPELKVPTSSSVSVQFGPNLNEMWCSTCHDPHDDTYPALLATSNVGSALCLECHIK